MLSRCRAGLHAEPMVLNDEEVLRSPPFTFQSIIHQALWQICFALDFTSYSRAVQIIVVSESGLGSPFGITCSRSCAPLETWLTADKESPV